CSRFNQLAEYDFREDLSVEVLGHIFEQSIADLEELRAGARGETANKKRSKRKLEGVFYTRAFVTRYIVEQALRPTLNERWNASLAQHQPEQQRGKNKQKAAWIQVWETYRDALKEIRVLDPACGSGAFLIAAFDYLLAEYERVND